MGSNPTFGTTAYRDMRRAPIPCVVSDTLAVASSLVVPAQMPPSWAEAPGTVRTVPPAVYKRSGGLFHVDGSSAPTWAAGVTAAAERGQSASVDERVMPGRSTRRFIGYPAGSLLAVLPDAESAAAAAAAMRAAGIPDRDITILRGPEGADRLDGTGAVNGVIARLRRLVSFTLMDQLVDMALYEAAVREGRAVLMVRPRDDAPRPPPSRPCASTAATSSTTTADSPPRRSNAGVAPSQRAGPDASLTVRPRRPFSSTNNGMTRSVLRW